MIKVAVREFKMIIIVLNKRFCLLTLKKEMQHGFIFVVTKGTSRAYVSIFCHIDIHWIHLMSNLEVSLLYLICGTVFTQ